MRYMNDEDVVCDIAYNVFFVHDFAVPGPHFYFCVTSYRTDSDKFCNAENLSASVRQDVTQKTINNKQ